MQLLDRVKFGNGHDGSPAVSGTINSYATCTGTVTQLSLTTTLSASANDIILIHQSQHATAAGQWEINLVTADAGTTLTLAYPLAYTYTTGAQAVLVPQYTGGTLSGAVTATSWAGSIGGIIALMSNSDLTISGSLTVNGGAGSQYHSSGGRGGRGTGGGFYGGNGANCIAGTSWVANQGEGTIGVGTYSNSTNGNGGGAGGKNEGGSNGNGRGGGGGNGTTGSAGNGAGYEGAGGAADGAATLTDMIFGGGGGGGARDWAFDCAGGGSGGGIVFVIAKSLTVSGDIQTNGGTGGSSSSGYGGGGGAGGSILIKTNNAILGTNKITASAGVSTSGGGAGGVGRIHLDYYGSYTGTTTPTLDYAQDTNLKAPIYGGII